MRNARAFAAAVLFAIIALSLSGAAGPASDIVSFPSGNLTLRGVLFKPEGSGPFRAVLYNHGSAAGMLSKEAFNC
jgi:hypothetical protein